MLRLFNIREGFGKADDALPQRFFEPIPNGPLKGKISLDRESFEQALDMYYQMAGWDEDGKPLIVKLYELDMEWVLKHT